MLGCSLARMNLTRLAFDDRTGGAKFLQRRGRVADSRENQDVPIAESHSVNTGK